ncbi:MAG: cysteine--tRNA ligase [Bacteroidales bacterium]|nr:cysteine--tRNA ligase [Bacteroidales bacterium]
MKHPLHIYNTLTRKKEQFIPLNEPFVGMYVCGPTVYGDPHLGHARSAVVFDVLFRHLKFLGYKVRYVRNITDVGHLEDELGEGEDKIEKKARLSKLEPMEIAQYYLNRYHYFTDLLNVQRPSIEPRASGHIIEQQEWIKKIIENDYAYETNGSVYFDVVKYSKKYHYGILSGRSIEELYSETRTLTGTHEKKSPYDFALWKKAPPTHIMKWNSPWSIGFPGWHLECSVMGTKYLGEVFDIHGGGIDLAFPHHECEIAQSIAYSGKMPVKYWIHNNLITLNNQKMSKSLNNFITLEEIFQGTSKLLSKKFSPAVVRFLLLQAHYRSTIDFSQDSLMAAEKALERLFDAFSIIDNFNISDTAQSYNINEYYTICIDALNDDLNTPLCISHLFELTKVINDIFYNKNKTLTLTDYNSLKKIYDDIILNILGLTPAKSEINNDLINNLMKIIIEERLVYRQNKNFEASDRIRKKLQELGIEIKDFKDRTEWKLKR